MNFTKAMSYSIPTVRSQGSRDSHALIAVGQFTETLYPAGGLVLSIPFLARVDHLTIEAYTADTLPHRHSVIIGDDNTVTMKLFSSITRQEITGGTNIAAYTFSYFAVGTE